MRNIRENGLSLRLKKPRRHVSAANRVRQTAVLAANEMWSTDFVSNALFDGRKLRALTVVHGFAREALAIDVDQKPARLTNVRFSSLVARKPLVSNRPKLG